MGVAGMYAGAQMAASPEELAKQQARWEKERVDAERRDYQSRLAHAALVLMSGANGGNFTPQSALESAHAVIQGAKTYNP
jgi:hypothetical protein